MSFHNLSVIVLNFESSTIIPILTITSSTKGLINQSFYPSIIVNFYNETNVFFNNSSSIITNITTKTTNKNDTNFQNSVIVPLYAVIFLLSVVGNSLVILTLAQNKRMRTVTNVYLLNLVSLNHIYLTRTITSGWTFTFSYSISYYRLSLIYC